MGNCDFYEQKQRQNSADELIVIQKSIESTMTSQKQLEVKMTELEAKITELENRRDMVSVMM
jgi:phage shock protein A